MTQTLDSLINQLDNYQHEAVDLGTPQFYPNETTQRILDCGDEAIPHLLRCLRQGSTSQMIAAVYCLGELGDGSIVPALRTLSEQLADQQERTPLDYTLVGQLTVALEKLAQGPRQGGQRR